MARRTLAQALQPAIAYARDGFPVSPIIAGAVGGRDEPSSSATPRPPRPSCPAGSAPKAGEWFRNPDYARTLQEIADRGIGTFYGGALGQRIVARLAALGGFITLDDLKQNAPSWVTPISVPFRGYRVWELPPNNQGVAALEMLRILEPYDLKAMGHNSAPYLHHLIEAKKLAYADLDRFVGDAEHLDMPAEAMLTDEFIAERRSHLDPSRAQVRVDPGPLRTQSETIYLTAADAEGNMVSFINSNYDYFGSGIVVPGTGFALHNRGAGFTLTPGLPNTVAPGKRPFHTLIPGFVTRTVDGREAGVHELRAHGRRDAGAGARAVPPQLLRLRHGSAGRHRRTALPPSTTGCGWRSRRRWATPCARHSRRWAHVLIDQPPGAFGGAQAIVRLPKGFAAGSDPRKDGMAVGY